MIHLLRAASLPFITLALASSLAAQAAPPAAAPQSTAPPRPGPALDGYQQFDDAASVPWKDANDAVGRIGGWKAYAREAQAGGTTDPATAAPAPAKAPDPHAGHGKQ